MEKVRVKSLLNTLVIECDLEGRYTVKHIPLSLKKEADKEGFAVAEVEVVLIELWRDPLFDWKTDIVQQVSRPVFEQIMDAQAEREQRLEPETEWEFRLATQEVMVEDV